MLVFARICFHLSTHGELQERQQESTEHSAGSDTAPVQSSALSAAEISKEQQLIAEWLSTKELLLFYMSLVSQPDKVITGQVRSDCERQRRTGNNSQRVDTEHKHNQGILSQLIKAELV